MKKYSYEDNHREIPFVFVTAFCFSPDGSKIISGGSDGSVYIHQISDNSIHAKELIDLIGKPHQKAIKDIAFSPDGQIFASVGDDVIKLWSIQGILIASLPLWDIRGYTFSTPFNEDDYPSISNTRDEYKGYERDAIVSIDFSQDGLLIFGKIIRYRLTEKNASPWGNKMLGWLDGTLACWRASWRAWFKICCDRLENQAIIQANMNKEIVIENAEDTKLVYQILDKYYWNPNKGADYLYEEGMKRILEDNIGDAISILTLATQFNPQHLKAFQQRGKCYEKLNDLYSAKKDFEKVQEINNTSEIISCWQSIELAESIIRESAILKLRTLNGHEAGVSSVCFSTNDAQSIISTTRLSTF